MKPKPAYGFFCIFALMALLAVAGAPGEFSPPSRTFLFTYQVTLKDIPAGAQRVRVWIPRAVTDANQTVVLKKVNGPVHLHDELAAPGGNHLLYGEVLRPQPGPEEFTVEYEVTRKEYSKGDYEKLLKAGHGSTAAPKDLARFLAPDRLVPIDGRIKKLADENTRGKHGTVDTSAETRRRPP